MSKTEQIIKTIHEKYSGQYIFVRREELMKEFNISLVDYNNLLNALRKNRSVSRYNNKKNFLYKSYVFLFFKHKGVRYHQIKYFN